MKSSAGAKLRGDFGSYATWYDGLEARGSLEAGLQRIAGSLDRKEVIACVVTTRGG
jgi:hypothetical protein